MQQEFAKMTQQKDTIKLDGMEKMKELEAEDKYKVLEFLVKEMMDIREQHPRE